MNTLRKSIAAEEPRKARSGRKLRRAPELKLPITGGKKKEEAPAVDQPERRRRAARR